MKNKVICWTVSIVAALVLTASTGVLAHQAPIPEHFSGIISDYTLYNSSASPTGPWEMRGHWSLDLTRHSGKADFSVFMTMELSDYWYLLTNPDPTMPTNTNRTPHTHHIIMTDATVSSDPSDTSSCPVNTPANTTRFVVNGTANFISANGNSASFEAKGPSTLQVCISGGTEAQNSNMTLVFTGPATSHFGTQAVHGVVGFGSTLERR